MAVPMERSLTRRRSRIFLALHTVFVFAILWIATASFAASSSQITAHSFDFESIDGGALSLSEYRGKTVLLVNVASRCGFVEQYGDLQSLWEEYRDRGLVVLGVPSNDFGGQEPGTEAEIKEFCEVNFNVDFPMTSKVTVRGADAHPFYRWAADELGEKAKPRWNFHKYLIGPDGQLVGWFPTNTVPTSELVTAAIERQLAAKTSGNS